jgi:hypothetical protein
MLICIMLPTLKVPVISLYYRCDEHVPTPMAYDEKNMMLM